jgi:hypothetical protein
VALLFPGAHFVSAKSATAAALITTADRRELEAMASLRGLAVAGVSDEDLRSRLLLAEGLDASSVSQTTTEEDEEKESYTLHVLKADRMRKDGSTSLVTLLGSVSASFLLQGQESERLLSANKMVVDLDNSMLSAMGGVTYQDADKNAAVQSMKGEMITLDWNLSSLSVNEGTTQTNRKNSEDEEITFFTTGNNITYDTSQGGISFDHGYITNNQEHAYSSITAEKLVMMDNGDMVMQNAYLSLGRIPIIWVPYFFFPGSRMLGNPAIGQESERGWFVNTTFGIYGSDPSITSASSSSFTRLLETDDPDAARILDGPVYRTLRQGESLSPLQQWAKDTGSYLSLLADSYENSGLSVGVVTSNTLWNKKLTITGDGRLAVTEDGAESLTTSSSYPKTRYLLDSSLKFSASGLNLTLSLPLYSDPSVKRTYANRFTGFSLDHLAGATWPTDYTSDITSYTWKANLSFTLPEAKKTKLLDSLSISAAQASAVFTWRSLDSQYAYRVSSVTLPSFTASMGGTLFSTVKTPDSKKETTPPEQEQEPSPAEKPASEETADVTLQNLLKTAFRPTVSTRSTTTGTRYAKLTYSLNEQFTQSASSVSNQFDWDATHYLYSLTRGSLTFDSVVDPLLLTFTQTFTPSFTYTVDKSRETYRTLSFRVVSSTVSTIPVLGLTYSLTQQLYNYTESTTTDEVTTTDEAAFKFTSSYVTTHQIVLSKTIRMGSATLTPSATYVLPPLTQSLTPALAYRNGNLLLSSSFKFVQGDDGILARDLITAKLAYDGSVLDAAFTWNYQSDEYTEEDPWGPLDSTGSLFLSHWGLTVGGAYDYETRSSSGDFYFNSLSATAGIGPLKSTMTYVGSYDALEKSTLVTTVKLSDWKIRWWKRRCVLDLDLDSSLTINYLDPLATNFSITASVAFSLAELLDLKFYVTSGNNGFFTYYDDDGFSWKLMMEDLLRSFDIFGNGVHQTQFTMSKLGLELVHYMDDWTLNCKYTGSVVLSNNTYTWVPVVAVYLQWKTIPELKVDQNWTKTAGPAAWKSVSSSST